LCLQACNFQQALLCTYFSTNACVVHWQMHANLVDQIINLSRVDNHIIISQ
jgi:hypothetical protein